MASALSFYFRDYETSLGLDNEDFFNTLLKDLYDAETFTLIANRILRKDLSANFTTTSTSFVLVTNSSFSHGFTYPNARIRCYNVSVQNSNSGQSSYLEVDISGQTPTERQPSETNGSAQRDLTCVAVYENLPVGVGSTIRLMAKVSAGTATVVANSILIYEIEEWA